MLTLHSLAFFNDRSLTKVIKIKGCTFNHKAFLKPGPALPSDLIDLDYKTSVRTWNGIHILQKGLNIHYIIWSVAVVYAYMYIKMISEILELNPDVDFSHPSFFRDTNTVIYLLINIWIHVKSSRVNEKHSQNLSFHEFSFNIRQINIIS